MSTSEGLEATTLAKRKGNAWMASSHQMHLPWLQAFGSGFPVVLGFGVYFCLSWFFWRSLLWSLWLLLLLVLHLPWLQAFGFSPVALGLGIYYSYYEYYCCHCSITVAVYHYWFQGLGLQAQYQHHPSLKCSTCSISHAFMPAQRKPGLRVGIALGMFGLGPRALPKLGLRVQCWGLWGALNPKPESPQGVMKGRTGSNSYGCGVWGSLRIAEVVCIDPQLL